MKKERALTPVQQSIIAYWQMGKSCSQIASMLSVTRNVVLGNVNRLRARGYALADKDSLDHAVGVKEKDKPARLPKPRPEKKPVARKTASVKKSDDIPADDARTRLFSKACFTTLLSPAPIRLMDLRADTCRWPLDLPEGQFYCGAACPADVKKPYCAGHAALAYGGAA